MQNRFCVLCSTPPVLLSAGPVQGVCAGLSVSLQSYCWYKSRPLIGQEL